MQKKTFTERAESFLNGKGFYIVLFVCIAVIGVSAWLLLFSEFSPLGNTVQDYSDSLETLAPADNPADDSSDEDGSGSKSGNSSGTGSDSTGSGSTGSGSGNSSSGKNSGSNSGSSGSAGVAGSKSGGTTGSGNSGSNAGTGDSGTGSKSNSSGSGTGDSGSGSDGGKASNSSADNSGSDESDGTETTESESGDADDTSAASAEPEKAVTKPTAEAVAAAEEETDTAEVITVSNIGDISFIWPLNGSISVPYSPDALIYDRTMGDWRTHDGVDLAAPLGTKVMAAADGVVTDIVADEMYGTTVVIDHGAGVVSEYSNLTEMPTVKIGDSVTMSSVIGAIGNTALCESGEVTHLHFRMTVNGESVNPSEYLP